MSYIRELERGRSFALFSFFSGEAKPGKPPLKDTLYSCFYIDGGVRANREPMTFILPPFADPPPLFTIEICGFSLSSAAAGCGIAMDIAASRMGRVASLAARSAANMKTS